MFSHDTGSHYLNQCSIVIWASVLEVETIYYSWQTWYTLPAGFLWGIESHLTVTIRELIYKSRAFTQTITSQEYSNHSATRISIIIDLTRFAIQAKGPDGKWTRKPLAYRESNNVHLLIACPLEICVNLVFKHIHAASSYTICRQFVPFIYCPL